MHKSNVIDKMVCVSALLTKLLALEKHSFATPPASLLLLSCSLRIILVLKKGECDRNV